MINRSIRKCPWLPRCVLLIALMTVAGFSAVSAQDAGDREAVLAANQEFYRAFRESDMAAMEAIWGENEPIAVEHPSTWREEGRARVLASWRIILRSPPAITCAVEDLTFAGGRASVICREQLNPGEVRMINIFHRENGIWRMIYHGPARDQLT
jgi:hypothetical protein